MKKNPKECVHPQGHSWYLTHWSVTRNRYERECSLMGCEAWQYIEGTAIAAERITATVEDKEHVHEWKPWNGVYEDTISDDLRYFRNCKNCKAEEKTTDLKAIGKWTYFPAEVAIRG